MSVPAPAVAPLGEAAITLTWGTEVNPALNALVHTACAALGQQPHPAVVELVPGYAALTVHYDPLHMDYEDMAAHLLEVVAGITTRSDLPPPGRDHFIPVIYDGPDLGEVARLTGMSRDDVIRRHSAPWYRVYLLGFAPGFAYLGDLDALLVLPRRGTPRKLVRAGSVAIAGAQTAIYPLDTPGGWHLLGRTTTVCFDPSRETPALLQPGDRVRFEPVAP